MALSPAQQKDAKRKVLTKRIHTLTIKFILMDADMDMQFQFHGDIEDSKKFVQSMRVKLSRLRVMVKERKKQLPNFKMYVNSYNYNPENNITSIILTKKAPIAEIEKDIDNLWKELNLDGD